MYVPTHPNGKPLSDEEIAARHEKRATWFLGLVYFVFAPAAYFIITNMPE